MNERLRSANWKDLIMYRFGRWQAYLIEGDSMTPTIISGEAVLVQTRGVFGVGDIVLAHHPYKTSVKILKRIVQIDPDGTLHLEGDNPPQSTDSRTFGAVSIESIIGKVVCRLK